MVRTSFFENKNITDTAEVLCNAPHHIYSHQLSFPITNSTKKVVCFLLIHALQYYITYVWASNRVYQLWNVFKVDIYCTCDIMQIYMPRYSYSHIIVASNFSGTNNSTINIRIIFQMKVCKGFTTVVAGVENMLFTTFLKNVLKGGYSNLYHHQQ